ncbi:MAG: protein kinase domain-containing protein [Myxococcota bacterium]
MIRLGAFQLDAPLGAGGMGEVWRARHVGQGTPAAVKVLTAKVARHPWFASAFRAEVRAVAGLDHPNVVMVFDHGEASEEAEEATAGRLAAGSPWLAMELAGGGTLEARRGRTSWAELREVLLALLDALAHAHAAGVVHRDIKPENVLLAGREDLRPGPWLSDFGIAHAAERDARAGLVESAAGTPAFMAPEQARGRWRDYGPWTDLFALGRTAESMLEGVRPPPGFDAWLSRLVADDPSERFRRAADAARGLLQLGTRLPGAPTTPSGREPPPLPGTWRRADVPRPSPRLTGAGLGLVGLRVVPLVGREREQDAAWRELAAAREGPRLLVLRGPAGAGKSRLASWLCKRADEVGGATVLRALHSVHHGPSEGLAGMAARHLRTAGLAREDVRARVAEVLRAEGVEDTYEVEALTEILSPAGDGPVCFSSPGEVHAVLRRMVERLAAERPVVVWIDDAHEGVDALAWAGTLLESRAPVLIVVTVGDEAIAERPTARAALERLAAGSRTIALAPLAEADGIRMVRALLGVEETLAARIAERAGGNPRFAQEVLAELARRGAIVATEAGFELRDGALDAVDVAGDGSAAIATALARCDEAERTGLQAAAALGQRVDGAEWIAVCARLGVRPPMAVVEGWIERSLAHAHDGDPARGWSFAHAGIRDVLERSARDASRWADIHAACADVLATRSGPGVAERLGRHRLGSGAAESAVDPLIGGGEERVRAGRLAAARVLFAECEEAMTRLGLPPGDSRWGRLWCADAGAARLMGDTRAARAQAGRAIAAGRAHGWARELALGLLEDAIALAQLGRVPPAWRRCIEAEDVARAGGVEDVWRRARHHRARVLLQRGDPVRAEEMARAALESAERDGDPMNVGGACSTIGACQLAGARPERAAPWFERARREYLAAGYRNGVAEVQNQLGEMARLRGDLETAERHYRASAATYRSMGAWKGVVPEGNRGLVRLAQGRFAEARPLFELARDAYVARGHAAQAAIYATLLLPCFAHARDWPAWDAALDEAGRELRRAGLADADLARTLRLAGDLAADAGDAPRARVAWALAAGQHDRLGQAVEAKAVRDLAEGARR